MKTRTLLGTAVLAIVALALTLPAVGQSASGSGSSIRWQIELTGASVREHGIAEYDVFKASLAPPATPKERTVKKFNVTTVTPSLADGNILDVYLGPGESVNEPYGKLVGTIEVHDGLGAMVLIGAKVPTIQKGTTVSIVGHGAESARDELMLKGTF